MKNFSIITISVVTLLAFVGLMFFAFSGNNTSPALDIVGSWRVVSNINAGSCTLPEREFMIFDNEGIAFSYRDDLTKPYVSSSYETNGSTMKLPDISREFVVTKLTSNIIRLNSTKDSYMYLVRLPNENLYLPEIEMFFEGRWQVLCHSGNNTIDEIIEFDNETMKDYRDGSANPAITSIYSYTENYIVIESMSLKLLVFPLSADTVILVDSSTGGVWELMRLK